MLQSDSRASASANAVCWSNRSILATDPHVGTVLKGEFTGLRRIRVGVYRVVFEVRPSELVVLVVRLTHRSSVYRR